MGSARKISANGYVFCRKKAHELMLSVKTISNVNQTSLSLGRKLYNQIVTVTIDNREGEILAIR